MANNQSWEYYQQPNTGTKYALIWIAGAANTQALVAAGTQVVKNNLYLIPFDQMRAATLSQIGINLMTQGGTGAKVRLGIYSNNASNDNYPKGLVLDAGELDVSSGSGLGTKFITGLNQALAADTRYWAAILGNDSTLFVEGLPASSVIFWGALSTGTNNPVSLVQLSKTYGALPDPAPVTGANDLVGSSTVPAILLAFSSVT
jgi:hypothetical protein